MFDVKVTITHWSDKCPVTKKGDVFEIRGNKIHDISGNGVCYYALSAMMPFLAAWQMNPKDNPHEAVNIMEVVCSGGFVRYKAERIEQERNNDKT